MLTKLFLSAVVLPFMHKGPVRGDRAYEERLPPLLPVEGLGPLPEHHSEDSPCRGLPLAPSNLAVPFGSPNKAIGSLNKAELAGQKRLSIEAAISLYLSEIEEFVGEAVFEVAWLTENYARFRNDSLNKADGSLNLALPIVTAAHMSRCLAALGHERLRRDGRHKGGDGRRAVLFYIRSKPIRRRAA